MNPYPSSCSNTQLVALGRTNILLQHLQPSADALVSLSPSVVQGLTNSSNDYVTYSVKKNVAVLTIDNPPVNALSPNVLQSLKKSYERALEDLDVKAIVITGKGKMFMAGADIEHLRSMQNNPSITQHSVLDYLSNGDAVFNSLESGLKPTVAAVHGDALGGGTELTLACNARIATDKATFGLPELTLGIIPGLGGTQRLPRAIGLEKALQLTLTSKKLKAKEALGLGLVNAIVKEKDLLDTAISTALAIAAGKQPRMQLFKMNDRIGTYEDGKGILEVARTNARNKNPHLFHPFAYIDAVEIGLRDGPEKGLQAEARSFAKCVQHPISKALIHFFFAQRATTKHYNLKTIDKPISMVAVLGGGTMGAAICIVYLSQGYRVILKEINDTALQAGVQRIIEQVQRVLKARKLPLAALEQIMRGLVPQTTYDGFDKADLVIEAVLENISLKQKVFAELEKVCSQSAILASNTSTIDLDVIGKNLSEKTRKRMCGVHFFTPAHVMPLIEIIRTNTTSPDTIAKVLQMSKKVGKTPVVVGNCVGFAANRAFFPYAQSAFFLANCGLDPYRMDKALKDFGMPMGVFQMCDLTGLDIAVHVATSFTSAYGERTYISTLAQAMMDAGRLGQKSGKGFYVYSKGKPIKDPSIAPFLSSARKTATQQAPHPDLSILSDQKIVEYILFPVVNEGLRIVEEKYVSSFSDLDVVTILGYGFPAWRGGLLHWAQHQVPGGWRHIESILAQASSDFGKNNPVVASFYKPSHLLQKLAQGNSD